MDAISGIDDRELSEVIFSPVCALCRHFRRTPAACDPLIILHEFIIVIVHMFSVQQRSE